MIINILNINEYTPINIWQKDTNILLFSLGHYIMKTDDIMFYLLLSSTEVKNAYEAGQK